MSDAEKLVKMLQISDEESSWNEKPITSGFSDADVDWVNSPRIQQDLLAMGSEEPWPYAWRTML